MSQDHPEQSWGDTAERPAVPAEEPIEGSVLPMEDDFLDEPEEYVDEDGASEPRRGGSRRAEKAGRGLPGCLAVLVALAVIVGGGWFGISRLMDLDLGDKLGGGPSDFSGQQAGGEVTFEVRQGDTAAQIGRNLKDAGVIASVDAFIAAATANPDSAGIQVGFYTLQKEMKAADALAVLVDPANIVTTTVAVPEGLRVVDIVELLAKGTPFKKADFQAALEQTDQLGLPDYAEGNPEGYLFPATYAFAPTDQPIDMLKKMVARWQQSAEENDLEAKAEELGYTPAEVMTIASLIEAEGRGDDMPKIARVIYNRLENPDNGVTNGLLQIDASVNYGLDQSLLVVPTSDDLARDTPYNTYKNPGLPPTPIEAPGDAAIQAALNPEDGDWLFYVTVNLKTGETKFTEDYDEFLQFKNELRDYCANESAGAC
ncbi:MAG TPA: endolytic transglycosylase MltG [Nocardioides sp.]|uniref:endolytic transglycosylase MltG n=1 Tax=Nocardioides sp. TaxID=35761 RepID=UPI002ED88350